MGLKETVNLITPEAIEKLPDGQNLHYLLYNENRLMGKKNTIMFLYLQGCVFTYQEIFRDSFNPDNYYRIALMTHFAIRSTRGLGLLDVEPIRVTKEAINEYTRQAEEQRKKGGINQLAGWMNDQIDTVAPGFLDWLFPERNYPPEAIWAIADVLLPTYMTFHRPPIGTKSIIERSMYPLVN